jgi:hypothetical protein
MAAQPGMTAAADSGFSDVAVEFYCSASRHVSLVIFPPPDTT